MAQTAGDSMVFRTVIMGVLAAFSSAAFLYGQAVEEPVAIRRKPVDKPAIPRPSAPEKLEDFRLSRPKGDAGGGEKKSQAGEATANTAKSGDPATGKGEEVEIPEGGLPQQFEKMCPVGRSFYGVRIPSYTEDRLNSVVTSEVMKRVDLEHLDMEKLVIQVYSAGEPDAKIMMDRAIYDTNENKLTSRQTPPKISHSQFDMVGDKMTFDRGTRIGHMTGNVKMTIFNVDSFLSEDDLMGGAGE